LIAFRLRWKDIPVLFFNVVLYTIMKLDTSL